MSTDIETLNRVLVTTPLATSPVASPATELKPQTVNPYTATIMTANTNPIPSQPLKQPTTCIILRRLRNVTPSMIHHQLLANAAILRITPLQVTRYPIREDAFVLKLELKHALALHNTLNQAIHDLFTQFSNPNTTKGYPSASGIIRLPLPPVPTAPYTHTIDLAPSHTVHNTVAAPVVSPWRPPAAPVSPDTIHWLLVGLALTLFAHWVGYIFAWSSLRNTTSYGLCWLLALIAKAIATAWDHTDQTRLWRVVLFELIQSYIGYKIVYKILGQP